MPLIESIPAAPQLLFWPISKMLTLLFRLLPAQAITLVVLDFGLFRATPSDGANFILYM
jgi:hypothetical protein